VADICQENWTENSHILCKDFSCYRITKIALGYKGTVKQLLSLTVQTGGGVNRRKIEDKGQNHTLAGAFGTKEK